MFALVTGGAGFIGGHLVEALVARGDRVRVLDNLATGRLSNLSAVMDRIEFVRGDVRDAETCSAAVRDVDVVFHEAAIPSVTRSVEDPPGTTDVNVGGTVRILDAARRAGVGRFVFAASSSAYGDTEVLPKEEQMRPSPLSPYAVAKLAGEHLVENYARLFGMQTCSLRYFNVFGPRQDPNSDYAAVIPRFVTRMLAGEAPVIFGDGEQTRDFCFIENVVDANLRAASAPVRGEVVNVACGERVSLNGLVDEINRVLGTSLRAEHRDARAGDVKHSLADIGAAARVLGYVPRVRFPEGLARTVAYFRDGAR